MGIISSFIWSTVWLSGLVFAAVTAFDFLDVPLSAYGPYLIWACAVIILMNVLPEKRSSLFDEAEP